MIVKNLQSLRKKDKYVDWKMATLLYYNEDISGDEMTRR
jgi:hypothetical protein